MFIADRYDLAEMLYKAVLVRESKNIDAMQELAIIYEATGQLQYARGLLTRALIIQPSDPEIIRRHAEIVLKLSAALESQIDSLITVKAYEAAIPKLAILLTIQPENADLYYKKAQCHLKLGNPDVALAEIERAQRITRNERYERLKSTASAMKLKKDIDTLTARARRSLSAGTPEGRDDAMHAITRILEIDPNNVWAKNQLARGVDDPQTSGDGWYGLHLSAWWAFIKRNASAAGSGVLSLTEVLRDHLDVLMTILLALIILGSPLTHMLVQGFSPRQSLSGRLEHFRLQELLTLINTHRRTGVLILRTPAATGKIYFDKGEVYHCKSGRTRGRAAVQNLLKSAAKGFFVFKDRVTSKDDTIDTPLSLILLGLPERVNAITSESILKKQKQQSRMSSLLNRSN
jgi:tetratricopeptide (TPR) repeat protein